MNRIILIGNGFDLAHNLSTSYQDFIEDYWHEMDKVPMSLECYAIKLQPKLQPSCYKDGLQSSMYEHPELGSSVFSDILNDFLISLIDKDPQEKNWVDIEEEYHKAVQECTKDPSQKSIIKLNRDFSCARDRLFYYLQKATNNKEIKKEKSIEDKIYSEFKWQDFPQQMQEALNGKEVVSPLYPERILFLNFNYTETEQIYSKSVNSRIETETIHIHGKLNGTVNYAYLPNTTIRLNPIIFGNGNETGEEYEKIRKLKDEHYLENSKSSWYSKTEEHKRLLDFIHLEKYQIFIFGHSCGSSDRTLLKQLFEDENCVSIKIFYHGDNYSELCNNILGHCTDESERKIREKIVQKKDSERFAL